MMEKLVCVTGSLSTQQCTRLTSTTNAVSVINYQLEQLLRSVFCWLQQGYPTMEIRSPQSRREFSMKNGTTDWQTVTGNIDLLADIAEIMCKSSHGLMRSNCWCCTAA